MKEDSSIRGEAQEEIELLKAQLKLSEEERNKAKEKEPVKTEFKKWWQLWKWGESNESFGTNDWKPVHTDLKWERKSVDLSSGLEVGRSTLAKL